MENPNALSDLEKAEVKELINACYANASEAEQIVQLSKWSDEKAQRVAGVCKKILAQLAVAKAEVEKEEKSQ